MCLYNWSQIFIITFRFFCFCFYSIRHYLWPIWFKYQQELIYDMYSMLLLLLLLMLLLLLLLLSAVNIFSGFSLIYLLHYQRTWFGKKKCILDVVLTGVNILVSLHPCFHCWRSYLGLSKQDKLFMNRVHNFKS